MRTLGKDLRYGLRMLAKAPGFTAVAALTIALGVAANTSIFSFVDAVIIRPLPYPHPAQLVGLGQWRLLRGQYVQAGVSAPNIAGIRKQNDVFQQVGYYLSRSYTLTSGNPPERLQGATLSANMLKLLGIQPALGRGFTPAEMQPGHDHEVILGYSLWQRQFAGKRDVLGKTIQLNDNSYTVIGVMPRNFYFVWDRVLDVITPLALPPNRWTEAGRASRDLQTMARLEPGVTRQQAQMEMNTIAGRLAEQYPDADKGWGIKVEPLHSAYHRHIAMPLIVILSASFLVLLIACVNVASLLLVRSTARRKEIAIRVAMGASRKRLIAQLLTESALLGLVGGLVGLLFSYAGVRLLALGCARYLPVIGTQWMSLNGSVLAFCLALAVLTGLLFGLAPAFQVSKINLNEPLKQSALSVTPDAGRRRLRNGLVAGEVCLAMVLMVAAGLLLRTFVNLLRVDVGFDPHNLLGLVVSLPRYRYKTATDQADFFQSALARIRALPGVRSAGAFLPVDEMLFRPEGYPPSSPEQEPNAQLFTVSPGFFQAMRTPLLAGREFTPADDGAAARVAIIDQTLAQRYFPNTNPIGRRLIPVTEVYEKQSRHAPAPLEIVGVVKDLKAMSSLRENTSEIFEPYLQNPVPAMFFTIRTVTPPLTEVSAVRSAVKSLDRELPLNDIEPLERQLTREYGSVSFPYMIIWVFAALALILSAVGIFGVVSYSVSYRTHEMAIRMALGAQREDVVRLVLSEGLRTAGLGLIAGIPLSLALARLARSFLFGVPPYDPLTLAVVAAAMAAVAALACYLPARRAMRVDPVVALREE